MVCGQSCLHGDASDEVKVSPTGFLVERTAVQTTVLTQDCAGEHADDREVGE